MKISGDASRRITAYLYLLPGMAAIIVFIYWPLLSNIVLSFTDYNFVRPTVGFRGLQNYRELFRRREFWMALYQSFYYVIGLWPFQVVFPLILAALTLRINHHRITGVYKVLIFSPTVLSFAIVCLVWIWILNPLDGILSHLLRSLGLVSPAWLRQSGYAQIAIIGVSGWKVFGINYLLFSAALVNVPEHLVEAARIDGATELQIFFKVKWALVTPTTFYVLISSMMFGVTQLLTPIQVMTKGGPYGSSMNIAYFVYTYGFEYFNPGVASAASVVTLSIMAAVIFIQFKHLEKKVHYAQ